MASESSEGRLPVTLVVPVWNRQKDVDVLIGSLKVLRQKPQRVILVDDCSDTPIRAVAEGIELEVVRMPSHVGTPSAKNEGLRRCDTEYVWFLDSDTEITNPDMLSYGVRLLRTYPSIGILGGEIRKAVTGENAMYSVSARRSGGGIPVYLDASIPIFVENDIIPTSNFLTRADLLRATEGFVPLMFLGEDMLASLLIKQMGYRNFSSTEFAVVHHRSRSGRNNPENNLVDGFTARAFLFGTLRGTDNVVSYISSVIPTIVMETLYRWRTASTSARFAAVIRDDEADGQCVVPPEASKLQKLLAILTIDNKTALRRGREYRDRIKNNDSWKRNMVCH